VSRSRLESALAQQIKAAGLPPPIREFRFAQGLRDFRADFAWPEHHLLVEISGGLWAGRAGGHTGPEGRYRDMRKLNLATLLGWGLLEFSGHDIDDGTALLEIEVALGRKLCLEWEWYERAMRPIRAARNGRRRRR